MTAQLRTNLDHVQTCIQSACHAVNRAPQEITVIAVTKTHTAETVKAALDLGFTHIGESRVQEAETKVDVVRPRGTFHLIGHLQSNKAKRAAGLFDWIQSIDTIEIAREISRRAVETNRKLNVLIETNSSGESQKHGCAPEEALQLINQVATLPHLTVRGFMTIGPLTENTDMIAQAFDQTHQLFEQAQGHLGPNFDTLSMGMSDDFEIAIRHGSTMIRLGSVLFGER